MKVIVKNPSDIVRNAWVKKVSNVSFKLVINTTRDECAHIDTIYFGPGGVLTFLFDAYVQDKVILEPENEDEKNILMRHRFERQCKDQITYLFLANEVVHS